MNNLFSIFDPASSIKLMSLNWVSGLSIMIFLPSSYWVYKSKILWIYILMINYLEKEVFLSMKFKTLGLAHFLISIFFLIVMNNFLGLFPYIFTASSHLSMTMVLAFPLWVGYMVLFCLKDMGSFLTHLVPLGTPYPLMPFMVVIEMISSVIRPLTLSVRLAANMIAGHLLMTLISSPMVKISLMSVILVMVGLLLLIMLELAVSVIQAYVFSTLMSLYVNEVNSPNLMY